MGRIGEGRREEGGRKWRGGGEEQNKRNAVNVGIFTSVTFRTFLREAYGLRALPTTHLSKSSLPFFILMEPSLFSQNLSNT